MAINERSLGGSWGSVRRREVDVDGECRRQE